MAVATTIDVSGTITGLVSGSITISLTTISTTAGFQDTVDLASGFNTLASPATATGCIFIPPAGNAVALTQKGVTGDTGTPLHLTRWNIINFASAGQDLGITAGSAVANCTVIWF